MFMNCKNELGKDVNNTQSDLQIQCDLSQIPMTLLFFFPELGKLMVYLYKIAKIVVACAI